MTFIFSITRIKDRFALFAFACHVKTGWVAICQRRYHNENTLILRCPIPTQSLNRREAGGKNEASCSNMSTSHHKLNPIYAALDVAQYSRAIKLAQAFPASNVLAQALLAHAYAKVDQRYKAMLVFRSILWGGNDSDDADKTKYFPELQLEIKYSLQEQKNRQDLESGSNAQQQQQSQSSSSSSRRGGKNSKKGKKRGGGSKSNNSNSGPAAPSSSTLGEATTTNDWDWVDALDTPPTLPDWWNDSSISLPSTRPAFLTDPTILATLCSTMLMISIRLPLTAYQLYSWAADTAAADELTVRKAFLTGLAVQVSPQYSNKATGANVTSSVLAQQQGLALQLARIQQQHFGHAPATAWAAACALWQLQQPSSEAAAADTKQQQRLAMLPRLAESLAHKRIQQQAQIAAASDGSQNTQQTVIVAAEAEEFLLYCQTLDVQNKWEEKRKVVTDRLALSGSGKNGQQKPMSPTKQTLLGLQQHALFELGQFAEARQILEDELLSKDPDNWDYWKRHLECNLAEERADSTENGEASQLCTYRHTTNFISKVLTANQENGYPLRAPHLVGVELAAINFKSLRDNNIQNQEQFEESTQKLLERVRQYGEEFCSRASSAFADLRPYLKLVLESCNEEHAVSILAWLERLRDKPSHKDPKERRKELRRYIFSIQVNYMVLAEFIDLRERWLPDWKELLLTWRQFQYFEEQEKGNAAASEKDESQKESRPADELVITAVQQILLCRNGSCREHLSTAAAILEAAIQSSPHNAYLKISAIFVYGQLNAVKRSWELFKTLSIKHIQHESTSYIILPLLRSGGFYQEIIAVCQEILRLQRAAVRDAGEYSARAMENGTVNKAEEIVAFQCDRLNNSLTTLEAKGLILDNAPLFIQRDDNVQNDSTVEQLLGAAHGIVGGDADMKRVTQMVVEAHNPFAAFSLLRLTGSTANGARGVQQFSENRDFSILGHDILFRREFDSPEVIMSESIRRGHHHSLLLTAALCIDATKGPKKGKAVKPSSELKKRCLSMLNSVELARASEQKLQPAGYGSLLKAMLDMCTTIAVLGAGIFPDTTVEDSLEARETQATASLQRVCENIKEGRDHLNLANDPSVARASRLLPDCIVPAFALFQMCAKVSDIFGWGRRKKKTKPCAFAIAEVASTMAAIIEDMKFCVSRYVNKSRQNAYI